MKNYWEFIRENLSYDIDETQKENFLDYDTDEEEWIENLEESLNFKSGTVIFHRNTFEVYGIDKNDNDFVIVQEGDFNGYGGPTAPKMEIPVFTINDIDVYPLLKTHFLKEGNVKEDNEVDMTRTVSYNLEELINFSKLPEQERKNILNSLSSIKKYKL